MEANWPAAFSLTESYEGWHKYSNDPIDPGGATYSGVTQRAYDAWRKAKGLGTQTVRWAKDSEIQAIASVQYWAPVGGDYLPGGLDLLMFDIAFNSGPVRAIKFLQTALGVPVDGHLGLVTTVAVNKEEASGGIPGLIRAICSLRSSFWHSLSTWWRFGKGWTNRGTGIQAKALALASQKGK